MNPHYTAFQLTKPTRTYQEDAGEEEQQQKEEEVPPPSSSSVVPPRSSNAPPPPQPQQPIQFSDVGTYYSSSYYPDQKEDTSYPENLLPNQEQQHQAPIQIQGLPSPPSEWESFSSAYASISKQTQEIISAQRRQRDEKQMHDILEEMKKSSTSATKKETSNKKEEPPREIKIINHGLDDFFISNSILPKDTVRVA